MNKRFIKIGKGMFSMWEILGMVGILVGLIGVVMVMYMLLVLALGLGGSF